MQGMNLSESVAPLNPLDLGLGYSKQLPDLGSLSKLTALTLGENMLQLVPSSISKLKDLRLLDLSGNDELKVMVSMHALGAGLIQNLSISFNTHQNTSAKG